jgi:hypothetical protein
MEEKNRNLKRGKTLRDNSDPRNHIRREDEDDNNTEGTPNRGFQGSGTVQDKKGLSLAAGAGKKIYDEFYKKTGGDPWDYFATIFFPIVLFLITLIF